MHKINDIIKNGDWQVGKERESLDISHLRQDDHDWGFKESDSGIVIDIDKLLLEALSRERIE